MQKMFDQLPLISFNSQLTLTKKAYVSSRSLFVPHRDWPMKCNLRNSKEGAACIELAVTLPVLLLIAFGVLELVSMIAVRQSVFRIANESCRYTLQSNLTKNEAKTFAEQQLEASGYQGTVTVETTPSLLSGFEQFTIRIDVQVQQPSSFTGITSGTIASSSASTLKKAESQLSVAIKGQVAVTKPGKSKKP